MIGKVVIGKSFKGCLAYCLHDKQLKAGELTSGEPPMKDRAEILLFNQCYGNEQELVQQFHEVRQLNNKLSKAVMHVTLSLSPDEKVSQDKLMEICTDCAKDMGFANNQYVAIFHKDTDHQHLHLIANRVGFDGKTVSDSNSYKKMAAYCRKMENKYELQKVLSPEKYLPKHLRNQPRLDKRKEKLKQDIRQVVSKVVNMEAFEREMKLLGYEVIKSRGIAFRDNKKVYTKGSAVGFSLGRIEQLLSFPPKWRVYLLDKTAPKAIGVSPANPTQNPPQRKQQSKENTKEQANENALASRDAPTTNQRIHESAEAKGSLTEKAISITEVVDKLLIPEQPDESMNNELQREFKKRKRKKGRSL